MCEEYWKFVTSLSYTKTKLSVAAVGTPSFWVVPGSVLVFETGCITSLNYPCFHFFFLNHCKEILGQYSFPSHIPISSLLKILRYVAITFAVATVAYEYAMK